MTSKTSSCLWTSPREVQAAIAACKKAIAVTVNDAVTTLRTETGISPSDIEIDMVNTTRVNSIVYEYMVGDVRLRFNI